MKREYLLLPLWAAMQSWGDEVLTGDDRPSLTFPTHSGLCGLIAAALGLDHHDHASLRLLHHHLNFIVMTVCPGVTRTDFYAVNGFVRAEGRKVDPRGVIIGRKTYLSDAAFVAAAYWESVPESVPELAPESVSESASEPDSTPWSLAHLGKALLHPHYALYAGRKSYPFSLLPVYQQKGRVPIFCWDDPLVELHRLWTQEREFQQQLNQARYAQVRSGTAINGSKFEAALFKTQRLPKFAPYPTFYVSGSQFSGHIGGQRIRDLYRPGTLATRQFDERLVKAITIRPPESSISVE